MAKKPNTIPESLGANGRAMWRRIQRDFAIEDGAGLALLEAACLAHEHMQEARAALDKHGLVQEDRFGQMRPSPWVNIERDSRTAMVSVLKALSLAPGDVR